MAMPVMRKSSDKIVITKGPGQYGDTQDDVAANPDCGTDRMQCEGKLYMNRNTECGSCFPSHDLWLDVLEKPVGWNFFSQLHFLCPTEDGIADGRKLHSRTDIV